MSGLSQSTIANMFGRNTIPTVGTLESICKGLGITMGQFFAEGNMIELSDEQMVLYHKWLSLSSEQKHAVATMIESM